LFSHVDIYTAVFSNNNNNKTTIYKGSNMARVTTRAPWDGSGGQGSFDPLA